ncbi:MAG TPA: hypothetical protein VJC21_00185 [Candidatus Nanoarchaeia archaeon]|nr:hypothetical protein [Candidatus Nanoarchaeia archaeon]
MKTYHEKNLVINNRELRYHGPFRTEDLFRTINKVLEEKQYSKREKKTEESVQPEGKNTFIELRPWKEKTPEVTLMLKIKMDLQNVQEALIEKEGRKQKMQQGDVLVALDAWLLTDYEHHWRMHPVTYFLRAMVNKFLYKSREDRQIMAELQGDAGAVTAAVQSLFKSYEVQKQKPLKEEAVRKAVAEQFQRERE